MTRHHLRTEEKHVMKLDPHNMAGFWDLYVTAADAGIELVRVSRTFVAKRNGEARRIDEIRSIFEDGGH